MSNNVEGRRLHITGVVQGVGFRPFIYGLARRLELTGWVRNTSAGVDIELDGPAEALEAFARALQEEAPPLARLDSVSIIELPPNGFARFEIIHSQSIAGAFQPISPDVTVCADCRREMFDPADRRYRYPFINCTNCGPRFTIIRDIPYDRPKTTMAAFPMCADCQAEYTNPLDRRFHAQPVACPVCGPHIWLEGEGGRRLADGEAALQGCRRLLAEGRIVAVKGLGGFHLACDAGNAEAVDQLRRRKLRVDKPFAIMVADAATAGRHCFLSPVEEEQLTSRERPIVILRRRPESSLAAGCAPGQNTIGLMLPYTPLHYLLLEPAAGFPEALVMTSGNLSEEPIAYSNEEARQRLTSLADVLLLHNRDIHTRCDDSVVQVYGVEEKTISPAPTILRRSRGFAPSPIKLPRSLPPILAAGAELKNAFCLTRDQYAFLSHHIGDLENYETLRAFETGVAHFEQLFRLKPELLAYDLHPNYLATRYVLERAEREGLPAVGVQHHHAHVAAAMAEYGLAGDRPVIGVIFDGTGYGSDGTIWGGEFLLADYAGYQRPYHLAHIPLLGGDLAVREPWRLALAWLHQAGLEWADWLPPVQYAAAANPAVADLLGVIERQLQSRLNAPLTSSMGRLFDAVAALIGVRQTVNYEAQAAIELTALAGPGIDESVYPFAWGDGIIDPAPLIRAIVKDLEAGATISQIAGRFHNSVAHMVLEICRELRQEAGLNEVALSGGVWQNVVLLTRSVALLQRDNFTVYVPRQVPLNDGGLALGQALVANSVNN